MSPLASLQWLYILYVLLGIAIGVAGIRAVVLLVRGAPNSYRDAVIVLAAGLAVGVVHIMTSRALRGKSMPVDAVVYTTVLTLLVFLLIRIPGIWQGVNFSRSKGSNPGAGGAAAIVLGVMCLTIQAFMGPTHTWNGVNYADAFHQTLTLAGWGLASAGGAGFLRSALRPTKEFDIAPAEGTA